MTDMQSAAPACLIDETISNGQAAKILKKSLSTLARWRSLGIGPAYIKNGGTVEYRPHDLNAYRLSRRRPCADKSSAGPQEGAPAERLTQIEREI
jgi:hypothetical protein